MRPLKILPLEFFRTQASASAADFLPRLAKSLRDGSVYGEPRDRWSLAGRVLGAWVLLTRVPVLAWPNTPRLFQLIPPPMAVGHVEPDPRGLAIRWLVAPSPLALLLALLVALPASAVLIVFIVEGLRSGAEGMIYIALPIVALGAVWVLPYLFFRDQARAARRRLESTFTTA